MTKKSEIDMSGLRGDGGRKLLAALHGMSAAEVEKLTGFHPEPDDERATYTVEFYEDAK